MATRPGPSTALALDEENTIDDLLMYTGRHCLGISRQQPGETFKNFATTPV